MNIDFNSDDYNKLGKFVYDINGYDIFGNYLNKQITIYAPILLQIIIILIMMQMFIFKQDLNDLN
jgi:hypothetical protein